MTGPLEWVCRAGLLGLVAASAWFYGGVEEAFQSVAAAVLAVACIVLAGLLVAGSPGVGGGGVWLALIFPLGLAAIAGLQLLGGGVPLESTGGGWTPRTLYPAETRLAFANYVATSAVVFAGVILFWRRDAFAVLLVVLVLTCVVLSVLGIGWRLMGADRLIRGEAVEGDPFARFVNRNNAAGFIQVGLASGLAWLGFLLDRRDEPEFGRRGRGLHQREEGTFLIAAIVGVAFCLAGLVGSRSRGGMLAGSVTVLIALPFLGRGRWLWRATVGASAAAAAAGLVLWLGLAGPAADRFRSLESAGVWSDSRFLHWRDALAAIRARPLWGAGAGTYLQAYPEFARYPTDTVFRHADGQFVELAVEMGLAGNAVLAAAVCSSLVVLLRVGNKRPAECVALAALLSGQATHALFDFALTLPAVSFAAGLLGGACLGRLLQREQDSSATPRAGIKARIAAAGLATAFTIGLLWAAAEHAMASAVDRTAGTAARLSKRPDLQPHDLDPMLKHFSTVLADRPDDADGQRAAAGLWVKRYELAAAERLREADPSLSREQIRWLTGLMGLHKTVNLLARSGATAGLDATRADPIVAENLLPARRRYEAAAAACPRMAAVWLPLAALAFTDPEVAPSGVEKIATESKLFPADAGVQRLAGRLAWQAGDVALASRCWRRAFDLEPDRYGRLLAELLPAVGAKDAVELTLPDQPAAALRAAVLADARGEVRIAMGEKLAGLAGSAPDGPLRARCSAMSEWFIGRSKEAETALKAAAVRYPTEAKIRADLGRLLLELGRVDDAMEALRVAVALDPDDQEVRHSWAVANRATAPDR